jgi:hypothetical protein
MATPRVETPRKAGCKPGGPSPWRRAYKPEVQALQVSECDRALPAWQALDSVPNFGRRGMYNGEPTGMLDAALAGNTTWEGRAYRIACEDEERRTALRGRLFAMLDRDA